jgi:hypothetical protein
VWSKRYDLINDFEKMLSQNGTTILKFFLHISPEEQLALLQAEARRSGAKLEDQRKRLLRTRAVAAICGGVRGCHGIDEHEARAWYIIPSNHKWFRNLAVSQIIADTMNEMGLKLPPTHVDITDIRRKYHAAEREAKGGGKRRAKEADKVA